jgi:hypothetical protein
MSFGKLKKYARQAGTLNACSSKVLLPLIKVESKGVILMNTHTIDDSRAQHASLCAYIRQDDPTDCIYELAKIRYLNYYSESPLSKIIEGRDCYLDLIPKIHELKSDSHTVSIKHQNHKIKAKKINEFLTDNNY